MVFQSTLTPTTPAASGVFKLSAAGTLSSVALAGTAAPGGAGTHKTFPWCGILANGTAYFESYLQDAAATYGVFHAEEESVQAVVTDLTELPGGSAVTLRNLFPRASGNYVGFLARRSGGHVGLFVHDSSNGITSKIVADGDVLPASNNAPVNVTMNWVNVQADGVVVFTGWPTSASGAFIYSQQVGGAAHVVAGVGMPVPTVGGTFSSVSLASSLESPINDSELVLFKGNWAGGSGLFVVPHNSGQPVLLVKSGDAAPSGGTFTTSSFTSYLLNSAGQAVFSGTTSASETGIFIVSQGTAPAKVVATGDPAPGGGTFMTLASPSPAGFNGKGEVVFFATTSGGAGLFLGTAGGAPQAVALNGTAAPSGGNYSLSTSKDARINEFSDILFQAFLTGGSADSGLFLRRAATGLIETVAVQGQVAPGTSAPFGTFTSTLNNYPGETTALGPNGEAWFHGSVNVGDRFIGGLFRYRVDGLLEKVVLRGEPSPGGLGGALASISQGLGAGRGKLFVFRPALIDAKVEDVIYGTPPAAPGDLTGDGRGDAALFRPSTGTWHIRGLAPVSFGAAGDVPVPADYNGDGRNEIAVYRPATATWLVQGQADVVFGQAGDIPIPGDYDGDGRDEAAVFRPSNGTWYVDGMPPLAFGGAGDIPVVADVDYDGRTDFTYFRPSTGTWAAYGLGTAAFGLPGDVPFAFDLGGNSEVELLVYRPGNSTWHWLDTAAESGGVVPFGQPGDIPISQLPGVLLGTTPQVTVTLHDAGHAMLWSSQALAGSALHGSAVVTGMRGTATGTVTFTWHANQSCADAGTPAGLVARDGTATAHPGGSIALGSTVVSLRAHYSGDGTYSPADACTPVPPREAGSTFTDEPVVPAATRIKAVHVMELRARVDAIRSVQGLIGFAWSDPGLTAGGRVRAVHVTDLRTALAEAFAAAARTPPTYTDASIVVGTTVVRAVHIEQLRAAALMW